MPSSEDGPLSAGLSPPDTSDVEQVDRQAEENALRQIDEDEDVVALLKLPQGRRFLRRLIGRADIHQVGFYQEPLVMARACGERALGIWLLAELQRIDPMAYPLLLVDAAQEEQMKRSREMAAQAAKQRQTQD